MSDKGQEVRGEAMQLLRRSISARVLLGVGAALVMAGLAVAFFPGGDERVAVSAGPNAPVNGDARSINAHNSPAIAQSPTDPDELVVVDKIDQPPFSAAVHVSADGGRSWRDMRFPIPRGEDRPYAPDLAWAADGTLYMSFVTLVGSFNSPGAVWLTSSRDSGRTWAPARRVLGPHAFQVRLAVDPGGRDVYLTWLQATAEAVSCASCFSTIGLPVLASHSSDEGATWSEPARVSAGSRERVGAPVPVVWPGEGLYVLYYDFKDDRINWVNLDGRYEGDYELVLSRSDLEARRFEETAVVPRVVPEGRFLVYQPRFPSLAVDAQGDRLYVAWADRRGGDRDVWVTRSGDRGRSWSSPVRPHADARGDQYLPKLSVAPNGRVDVAYLDRSADPADVATVAALATSLDSGRTWSSILVSDRPFDSRVGPEDDRGRADQGTRLGMVSTNERALLVWTDARRGTRVSAKQDIFFAPVSFAPQ